MVDEREPSQISDTSDVGDSGLRCPECQYNLTGLTESRCPECGTVFDWQDVRLRAGPATIAFERARGWAKLGAIFVTWATVLFVPWIFARQAVQKLSTGWGLLFGTLCFLPVTCRYVFEGFDQSYLAWLSAAAIYIIAQAMLMIGLDPHGWRKPGATFLFWLGIGGYTTAVVATECFGAAPLLALSDLWEEVGDLVVQGDFSEFKQLYNNPAEIIYYLQMAFWLLGLACCYVARLRKAGVRGGILILATIVCIAILLNLYAFCVDPVGTSLFELYGGSIW